MNRLKLSAVMAMVLIVLAACTTDNFKKTTYQTLASSKASYEQAMLAAQDLQKQGKLSQKDADMVGNIGDLFYTAYLTALAAYNGYIADPSATNQQKVTAALSAVQTKLGAFLAAWAPFVGGGK